MDDEEEPPLLLPSESKSLLGRTAFTPPVAPPDNSRRRRLYTLGAFVTVFGVGLLGRASVTVVPKQNALLAEDTFTFTSTNEYGSDLPGGGHYPGMAFFAEPYKKTGLDVVEPTKGDYETSSPHFSYSYRWTIAPPSGKAAQVHEGYQVDHTFEEVGTHSVLLERLDGDGDPTHTTTESVVVKYVKRELRTMTGGDRDAFFNALKKVYTLSTAAGQETYGENFIGIDDLVAIHLEGAGAPECDHWHDDAGIMTHHLGFTLLMEASLQAVNPAVTIPYWEYTIDSAELGSDWRTSKIFSEDWFGNSGDKLFKSHHVTEGRWADLAINTDATGMSPVTNAYGMLRSPWNLNDSPYVTRFNKVVGDSYFGGDLPSCSAVKSCFDSTSLADMNVCLNGQTHGPIHVLIGGQWDVNLGERASRLIGPAHLLLFKDLWRRGYAKCPSTASEVDAGGTCACPSALVKASGGAYEVLTAKSGAMHWMAASSQGEIVYDSDEGKFHLAGDHTEAQEEEVWEDLLTKLCNPGQVGEMYSSSAPYDPLFWVLHTTSERLLQYRRLKAVASAKDNVTMPFDETWGYSHMDSDSDIGVVCDWSSVSASDPTSVPVCTKGTCSGHKANDKLPFDLSAVSKKLGKGTTNQELYDWLSPTNPNIPYVYDTFKYEHCMAAGVDVGDSSGVQDDTDDIPAPHEHGTPL